MRKREERKEGYNGHEGFTGGQDVKDTCNG